MVVCIVGGRDFQDYIKFKKEVNRLLENIDITEIVSGGATGTDSLAERYAIEKQIPMRIFKADWIRNGKAAGPIRNREMLSYVKENNGKCIAFWNDLSKGTENDINICSELNIPIQIIHI